MKNRPKRRSSDVNHPRHYNAMHIWAYGGYPDLPDPELPDSDDDDTMPCECAT